LLLTFHEDRGSGEGCCDLVRRRWDGESLVVGRRRREARLEVVEGNNTKRRKVQLRRFEILGFRLSSDREARAESNQLGK